MAHTISFYTQGDDTHEMNKTLTAVATDVSCNLKEPVDVEKPVVTVSNGANYDKVNYAYIGEFNRYYYVKPIAKNNAVITFELESDVLMSFKTGIKASPAVIARNPWKYDKYLPDNKLPIESRTVKGTLKFPVTNVFDGTNNCYILTTIGCGGSPLPEPGEGGEGEGGEGE